MNTRTMGLFVLLLVGLLIALGACNSDSASPVPDRGPSRADGSAGRYAAGSADRAGEMLSDLGDAYRLEVLGAVNRPLSLSYDEVRSLPQVRSFVRLTCPGFFYDEGYWTGTSLKGLLDRAGVREGARSVRFVAADGGYRASLKLPDALADGVLVAWEFDDRPFPRVHGFPLRVVAPGQAGSQWVKWLGQIVVE